MKIALLGPIIKAIVTVASSVLRKQIVKIGELAQKTGCPVTRIRFYEQKGLLPAPSRSPGGQRNYTEKAAERLEFISTCRANGMKLECIERFIAYEKDPSLGSQWLLDRIDDYLAQAKIQREKLDKAEKYLQHLRATFPEEILAKKKDPARGL